ncbi:hypothetical protein BGZ80_006553 [Entomortierella chlamydospora]|uniref:pyridoxal kinase n=1 Tax=Entomortierella chlamydospora TaxID=101097 RepID=A0A9P6T1W4_9FUNG|nr:hypothetical protein BGZ79_007948 [Entomortierella chlamydospora]KAG0018925.1 hypothetical protein BGZ80_006553 [Entomortierella chlamydospora]
MSSPRVLSIQSHIVSGYCGNKAATFPLQLLGFDVDVMNTVNFSNHTGYPSWTGEKATGEQLTKLYEGLQTNGLVEYTHILTGYIGSAQNLAAVIEIVKKLRSHGDPFFVLDPVMGDNGQLYVQPDVIPLYRELMRYANAVTPNQFEAETLADKKILDVKSCLEVIEILHNTGVENVVITSVSLSSHDVSAHLVTDGSVSMTNGVPQLGRNEESEEFSMYCVCSSKPDQNSAPRVFAVGFPSYDGYFTGTGDLFSSLLVARLDEALRAEEHKSGAHTSEREAEEHGSGAQISALANACLKVVSTMKAVVLRTYLAQKAVHAGGQIDKEDASSAAVVKQCELRLIQSKKDIEYPNEEGVQVVELRI